MCDTRAWDGTSSLLKPMLPLFTGSLCLETSASLRTCIPSGSSLTLSNFVGSPASQTAPPAPNELANWPELPQNISTQVDTFPESSYGATTVTLVLSDGRRIERVVVGGRHIVRIGDRAITHVDQLGFAVSSIVAAERYDSPVSRLKTYLGRLVRGN